MVELEFVWKSEGDSAQAPGAGAVVVSSFPSAGFATTVAGHYIIRALQLPRVARFESPELAPVAVVQGGEVHPTIRVYGRSDLGLVLSEFPPSAPQANAIAEAILGEAERLKARLIVGIEGVVPHPTDENGSSGPVQAETTDDGGTEQVWGAFSSRAPKIVDPFVAAGVRPLEEGVIGGVSGALLVQGMGRSVPVSVLLVSTRAAGGLPDHRAGAALIETMDRLLPQLKIDTGPLRKQAEQIERMLRTALKTRPAVAAPEESTGEPGMYG